LDFLFSNLPPVRTDYPEFSDIFYSLIKEANRLDIAVGYITADSLAELKQMVAYNKNIEILNLIIGMHYWDKFTAHEYNAALKLNEFLQGEKRGEVRLVTPFRFHGKLYSYSNAGGAFAGIIGSNNLSSILDNRTRIYEASAVMREQEYAEKLLAFIEKLKNDATDNIIDCNINESDFRKTNTRLDNHEEVSEISENELADIISSLTNIKFKIPLVKNGKVPPGSNLNCYFGKGRLNTTTGVMKPRHWYEVELMVPKTITDNPDYPKKDTPTAIFDVVTDDRFKFKCYVSGDFSKNFRSDGDLKILGRWIKGRLENKGALEIGELVTPETFTRYRRDDFTLTKTTIPNLWYLNFGENE